MSEQYNSVRLARIAEIAALTRQAARLYLTAAVSLEVGESLETVANLANLAGQTIDRAGMAVGILATLDDAVGYVAPEITDEAIAAASEALDAEWEAMASGRE